VARRKQTTRSSQKLFAESQMDMFEKSYEERLKEERNQPVKCLGMTFSNDEERREYFLGKLRDKLKDPEFRQIEGFPIGDDKDILALSDPPYYTACPNPFIKDYIIHYGHPYNPETDEYMCKPFAADIVQSRNNPFVNAHSYATKVPHRIVMQYLLHYTKPGDLVFDPFAGTGMTAVAAQLCENPIVEGIDSLGKSGARPAINGDLSPAATAIARTLNIPDDLGEFLKFSETAARKALSEFGWMYETLHTDGKTKGKVHCTLWSDVFICPECSNEIIYWDAAVNIPDSEIKSVLICPHCTAENPKRRLIRAWETHFDPVLKKNNTQVKTIPRIVVYSIPGSRHRFEKLLDDYDWEILRKIERTPIPDEVVIEQIPKGDKTGEVLRVGLSYVHQLFTLRNLHILTYLWNELQELRNRFTLTALMYKSSRLCAPLMSNYFAEKHGRNRGGWVGKERSGTLYYPSIQNEVNVLDQLKTRTSAAKVVAVSPIKPIIEVRSSSTTSSLPSNIIDYIFTDPPFGENRMYSELNFLWETWLRVRTNNQREAIINRTQGKNARDYGRLMEESFTECYRVLKPGRWITVEFSNTKASVWNQIQTALSHAGFVVADVRTLAKGQGSINVYNTRMAVKQDLAISAYKPNGGFEKRFRIEAATEEGVWDFVRTHLKQLPVFVSKEGLAEVISERHNYLLFDRMVAFHVQRDVTVPMSAAEFYAGLEQRFPSRDSMYFLPEQAAEYDKKRMTVRDVLQLQLFVSDEASAIQWLNQQLTKKPQTFQDIHPQFLKEIGGWQKHEKALELSELLEQNFLRYGGKGEVPSQIHSYLSSNFKDFRKLAKDHSALKTKGKDRWYVPDPNKVGDLEKLRERALLREFQEYVEYKKKRLKVFRLEAVRAGFKKAWQERNYATIIGVAHKIPEKILQEDPKLLMWYDQAVTRTGEDS